MFTSVNLPPLIFSNQSQLHPELLEHIFQFAFDACEDAHESLSLLRAISQLDHLWAEYATSIRALHCLTVSTHDDLRQHARLCNRQPRASRMLRVLIVQLDLTDSSGQVSAANLRSFLPRAPNIQHLCFRYKPLPAAADGGGAVKGPAIDQDTVDMRNIFSRHNWYGFWMQLEQVSISKKPVHTPIALLTRVLFYKSLRLLQGLVSIERIHPCLMPTSESGDHVCGNTVKVRS